MKSKWVACGLVLLGWSARAGAQEPCVVNATITGKSCKLVAPNRSERECTTYQYVVESDRAVTLETITAGQAPAPCAAGTCTVSADAERLALTVVTQEGARFECRRGGAAQPPKASPSKPPANDTAAITKALEAAFEKAPAPPSATPRAPAPASSDPGAFERVRLRPVFEGEATGAPIVDDLLRSVAAVALERAQARAAQRLIDTATEALCDENTSKARRTTWQRSCEVLAQLTPATLGTVAEALREALAADVAHWIVDNVHLSSPRDGQYLSQVITEALMPVLTRPSEVTRHDLLRVVNAIVTHEWEGPKADVVNLAFSVVRACANDDSQDGDCDIGAILAAAPPVVCQRRPEWCETLQTHPLRIELLAAKLSVVVAQRSLSAGELERSLRNVVDITLSLAEYLSDDARRTATHKARLMLLAMLADEAFSFALYIGDLVPGEALSPKVHALLNAVLTYARTYAKRDEPSEQSPAERRKEIIEALVTATTDRLQRDDDWIVSLGVDVGFGVIGYQRVDGDGDVFTPQLSMPLGIYLQHGPKGWSPGFHAGAFVADVAQYASYESDGTTTDPRWDTAFAVGTQLGVVLGSIADPFVVGLDARYAPTLFSDAASSEPTSGGTLRLGLFASYYVSFFDMN